MPNTVRATLLVLFLALGIIPVVLSGCGQTGALYLPGPDDARNERGQR